MTRDRASLHQVLIASLLLLSGAARAAAVRSLDGLLACRDIADAAERLACFDREAAALAPAPTAPAKTAPVAVTAPAVAPPAPAAPAAAAAAPSPPPAAAPTPAPPDARQTFGLSARAVEEKEAAAGLRPVTISRIEAHIVRTAHTSDGYMVFTLDNDQVWRQIEVENILVNPGETVTISHAALGSYWLKMSSGRGCKVTRLR